MVTTSHPRRRAGRAAAALLALGLGAGARAEDKSAYTLFDPTPRSLLRPLSPDRPDFTESPYTVDAGHFQIETSFAEWVDSGDVEQVAVLPTNLKVGLTNQADLQLVVSPYLRSRGFGQTDDGHGDAQLRLKVNVWGNDGGDGLFGQTALAIMPVLQFPVGADAFSNDDHVEGSLIVPFSMPLPYDIGLTVMAELDWVRDGTGGYDTLFAHSVSLGFPLAGDWNGYFEYFGFAALGGDQEYLAAVDTGLTYSVSEDLQLDTGIEFGLTSTADDLRVFVGMTYRL